MIEFLGIVFVVMVGFEFGVFVIFVRKRKFFMLMDDLLMVFVYFFMKKIESQIVVFGSYLFKEDCVLIIDDFLVNGQVVEGFLFIVK